MGSPPVIASFPISAVPSPLQNMRFQPELDQTAAGSAKPPGCITTSYAVEMANGNAASFGRGPGRLARGWRRICAGGYLGLCNVTFCTEPLERSGLPGSFYRLIIPAVQLTSTANASTCSFIDLEHRVQ